MLPSQKEVYRNLQGRTLTIPVIHVSKQLEFSHHRTNKQLSTPVIQSPPWIFVDYHNGTALDLYNDTLQANNSSEVGDEDFFNVTGGRDDNLIKLLASKLNFKY